MLLIKEARYPESCGRKCEFCIFDADTDSYRCVFFGDIENEVVDEMAIKEKICELSGHRSRGVLMRRHRI